MKNFLYSLLLLTAFLLLLSSCTQAEKKQVQEKIPVPKEIQLTESTETKSEKPKTAEIYNTANDLELSAKVDIDPRYVLLFTQNTNLDFDQTDEQILVLKPRDNPDSLIHIAVVDFDTVSNQYIISWQANTLATNIRTFSVNLGDLVGDHNLEIVCTGINSAGERTLDIFRKTLSPEGTGVFYTSICSVTADGSIEIQEHERSQAYKLGQKNGLSFPIITYSNDKNSENLMDLIKTEYYWKYQDNKYIVGKIEHIPGKKIEEQQLKELFTQNTEAFENFLKDPWFKETRSSAKSDEQEVILFSPQEKQISFYTGNIEEIYDWSGSHRTRIPNSIYITVKNNLMPFIEKQISIYITSMDTIQVQVNDGDFKKSSYIWDGTYHRLSSALQQDLFKKKIPPAPLSSKNLAGTYTSSDGNSLTFQYPDFRWIRGSNTYTGMFSVYTLESKVILELKILNKSRTVMETQNFSVQYSVEENEQLRISNCSLTPGRVGVYGFKSLDDKPVLYQKYDVIEEQNPAPGDAGQE